MVFLFDSKFHVFTSNTNKLLRCMEGKKISKDDMNIEHLDVSRNQII